MPQKVTQQPVECDLERLLGHLGIRYIAPALAKVLRLWTRMCHTDHRLLGLSGLSTMMQMLQTLLRNNSWGLQDGHLHRTEGKKKWTSQNTGIFNREVPLFTLEAILRGVWEVYKGLLIRSPLQTWITNWLASQGQVTKL